MEQQTIPKHVAIIMDGNRRWAREHGLPVLEGHRRVADDILDPLIEHASNIGITHMTFWAWSTENWERDKREVAGIMKLFHHIIQRRWDRLHEQGVRIKTIGDISKFDTTIKTSLERLKEQTKHNTKITATFALNYGGRDEILRSVNAWEAAVRQGAATAPLTADGLRSYLDTGDTPDPDLIIRTGGEVRLSGFLLWQSEYSELYFPSWYMPDFTPERLDEAVAEYARRQRRFGK